MIDLGDVRHLVVKITDSSGAAANAGAVTCTITLPDLTTTSPSVSNPSTGQYVADYPTTQVGRHLVRWVATGANAGAFSDVFDVAQANPYFVISLDDARTQLQKVGADTTSDERLRDYLTAVTHIVEQYAGPVLQRTKTLTVSGGQGAILLPSVAAAITSVTENGTVVAVGGYTLDATAGILYRGTRLAPQSFATGDVVVTYTVGQTFVPANVRIAAAIILRHLWQEEMQGNRPTFGNLEVDTVMTASGFAVPRRAIELLRATPNVPGFA